MSNSEEGTGELNSRPLVSIIALCYNQANYCLETLNSIKNQNYSSIELILIDDCSTDNSVDIINNWINAQSDLKVTFIIHDKNLGICKSLNEGLELCTGSYFSIFACDDIMMPDKLISQVRFLSESEDNVGAVYSNAYLIDDNGKMFDKTFKEHRGLETFPSGYIWKEMLQLNCISISTQLTKRETIEVIGSFDESLAFEDYDFNLRLSKNFQIIFLDELTVKYRIHDQNFTNQITNEHADSYIKLFEKQMGESSKQDKILKMRILELTLTALMKDYKANLPLLESYKNNHSPNWVIDTLIGNRFFINVFFKIVFRFRANLIGLRKYIYNLQN